MTLQARHDSRVDVTDQPNIKQPVFVTFECQSAKIEQDALNVITPVRKFKTSHRELLRTVHT